MRGGARWRAGRVIGPPQLAEALDFSGIVLPADAQVLGLDAEKGIDARYRLAFAVDEAGADRLLADSRFGAPLVPVPSAPQEVLPGVPVGQEVAAGGDELARPGRPPVVREVMVDRSDPVRVVVHVWAYTT